MSLEDGVLIACKEGVVELTATITDPSRDDPETLGVQISNRIFEHQYQVMTDPAILNPLNLRVATTVLSREPFSAPIKEVLVGLNFTPIDSESGAREERSLFSRLQRPRRVAKLEKWRTMYLRAEEVSSRLGELEETLVDEVPRGTIAAIMDEGSDALIRGTRTYLKTLLAPSFESLGQLERLLVQERASLRGRLVLHPAFVRAIACFLVRIVQQAAPSSTWSDDPEDASPFHVEAPGGGIVRSDPEFRVVSFVAKGSKALLTAYVESVLRQSLTKAAQT